MKKIGFLICLILISGCSNDYFKDLGYTNDQTKIIRCLDQDDQVFFSENYGEFTCGLLDDENFISDNLAIYKKYQNILTPSDAIALVNKGVATKYNVGTIKALVNTEGFEIDKLESYLKYAQSNPVNVVYYVNNDLTCDFELVKRLAKDACFVIDNLPLYLQYLDEKESDRELIEYVNSKNYLKYYEEQIPADIDKYGYQVLVNKFYYLASDYEPTDLVAVESTYGVGELRKEAYAAFIKMYEAATAEGLNFYITSPYRSYETQEKLYNYYLSIDSQEAVDIYSARPGSSEHQLGLAVDILKRGYDFGNFETSKEAEWLADNAYKFGFILRYPADKVAITGYKYESWHYRYVGEIAQAVYDSGVSYDEYFEAFIKER